MVGYVADACHMSGQGEKKSMSITFNVPRTSCHSSVDNPAVTVSTNVTRCPFSLHPHFTLWTGSPGTFLVVKTTPLPPCLFSCIAYCRFTVCCGYLVGASVAIRIINCVTPNSVLPQ